MAANKHTVSITVFLDGVEAASVPAYNPLFPVTYFNSENSVGKWSGLCRLIESVPETSEAVVFCDASTFVPKNFITELILAFDDSSVVAVAPNYRPRRASKLALVYWKLEEIMKAIEGFSGGSISVHGALVSYRCREVKQCFDVLSKFGIPWIHDDLVIPLTIRRLNPGRQLVYRTDLVALDFDTGPARTHKNSSRMAWGNWQWISKLLVTVWQHDLVLFVVSLRRVVRCCLPILLVVLVLLSIPFTSPLGIGLEMLALIFIVSISPSVRATLVCFGQIVAGKRQSSVWG